MSSTKEFVPLCTILNRASREPFPFLRVTLSEELPGDSATKYAIPRTACAAVWLNAPTNFVGVLMCALDGIAEKQVERKRSTHVTFVTLCFKKVLRGLIWWPLFNVWFKIFEELYRGRGWRDGGSRWCQRSHRRKSSGILPCHGKEKTETETIPGREGCRPRSLVARFGGLTFSVASTDFISLYVQASASCSSCRFGSPRVHVSRVGPFRFKRWHLGWQKGTGSDHSYVILDTVNESIQDRRG